MYHSLGSEDNIQIPLLVSQEELVLFKKSDNSIVFESSFSPNKIILGVFWVRFRLNFKCTTSIVWFQIKTKISFLFLLILFFLIQFQFLNELNLKDFKCLNAIVGHNKYDNQTVYRYLCAKSDSTINSS